MVLTEKRKLIIASIVLFLLVIAVPISLYLNSVSQDNRNQAASVANTRPTNIRGISGDLWADVLLGKRDFSEISPREIVPNRLFNPGGVIVDRSVAPGRAYIWDSGNNRILGIDLANCYENNIAECSPSIVIGQPSFSDYGACNQNAGAEQYPNRVSASASTLCSISEFTHTTLEDKSFVTMTVDAQGNLYVPDVHNHRVLKYISPFTTDTTADEVWGQGDFSANTCNRGQSSPSANSLCFGNPFGAAVSLDNQGNLWVADGKNNRVVRFSKQTDGNISKTADLVLGQTNLTSNQEGSGLNGLKNPTSVAFDSQGKAYIGDNKNNRILTFTAPFSNGQAGTIFLNNFRDLSNVQHDPLNRGIWTTDSTNSMGQYRLWNYNGTLRSPSYIHGRLMNAGGGLGIDANGEAVVSVYGYYPDVYRLKDTTIQRDTCAVHDGNQTACGATSGCSYYGCSSKCWASGTSNDIACANISAGFVVSKRIFNVGYKQYNRTTNRRLEHAAWQGLGIIANQLIVADGRLVFWNNYRNVRNGQPFDGYVGASSSTEIPDPGFGQVKTEKNTNTVWATKKDKIYVYQAPLETGEQPIKIIDTNIPTVSGGQLKMINALGIAVTSDARYLWIAEQGNHRVFRVRNPLTNPVVDIILGQTQAGNNIREDNAFNHLTQPTAEMPNVCNRGEVPPPNTSAGPPASLNMLCFPGALSIDKQGNLYVADHSIETAGNWRLLMFKSNLFPDNPTTLQFATTASKSFPKTDHQSTFSHMAFEPAFDSYNRMVVGQNPYYGNRAIHYYDAPTLINPSNPSDPAFAVPTGKFKDFYNWPIAATFDEQDNLYVLDANRGRVMVYNKPFNSPPTTPPTPTPTPSPTPVPTPTPIPTPTPSPTPYPTFPPEPTPVPNFTQMTYFSSDIYANNFMKQFVIDAGKIYRREESANGWTGWENITGFVDGNPDFVGEGTITSFASDLYRERLLRQFLVRNGRIHRRTETTSGWSGWEDITSFVNGVGQGTITGFTNALYQDNYYRQFLVRDGKIYRRTESASGWSAWEDISYFVNGQPDQVGSGTITGFTSGLYRNNYLKQFLIRNRRIYRREESASGWTQWQDITDFFNPGNAAALNQL